MNIKIPDKQNFVRICNKIQYEGLPAVASGAADRVPWTELMLVLALALTLQDCLAGFFSMFSGVSVFAMDAVFSSSS